MSMLAEPRIRQKWSEDPRNTKWSSDKTKFGYQMLTKMGWSEGRGLGQNLSGTVSHVKVKKRMNNAGIGLKKSHDDDWISHQDDFNALLQSLNQGSNGSSSDQFSSLEDRVKSSKKKILYKRFVKSKDLSKASSQDLACIFGQRSKSTPATPQDSDEENISDDSTASCPAKATNDSNFKTIDTGVSVADYFAKKMAALKQTQHSKLDNLSNNTEGSGNMEENLCGVKERIESKKKKKRKRGNDVEEAIQSSESYVKDCLYALQSSESCEMDDASEKKKKKKKKRTDYSEEPTEAECTLAPNINGVLKKGEKQILIVVESDESSDVECIEIPDKKRKRKRKEDTSQLGDVERSNGSEKKNRRKRKRDGNTSESSDVECVDASENKTKKKKSKDDRSESNKANSVEISVITVDSDYKKGGVKNKENKKVDSEKGIERIKDYSDYSSSDKKKKKKKKKVKD